MIQHLSRRSALSSLSGLFLAACGSSDDEPGSEPGPLEPSDPNALESGYGPLVEKAGAKVWLPEGFRYVAFGAAGSMMSDGNKTPGAHDGMAAFAVPGKPHLVRLVRNHELAGAEPGSAGVDEAYDSSAPGAVTIVEFDTEKEEVTRSFLALAGTIENCNGGANHSAGWWLTCEESTEGSAEGYEQKHGYVFLVRADADGAVEPTPIKAAGRFVHEAAVTDPRTQTIYLTEDEGPDGLYRFVPDDPSDPTQGGVLSMLAVVDEPEYDTTTGQTLGKELSVTWVTIDDPDPEDAEENPSAVHEQGRAKGGAFFLALEGACFHEGSLYFTASEGGDAGLGQVWRFTPDDEGRADTGVLSLVYESSDEGVLQEPDNLCVSPRGALVVCEDGDGEGWTDEDDSCRKGGDNFVRIVTRGGKIFDFAKVVEPLDLVDSFPDDFEEDCTADPLPEVGEVFGASEATGATFSPDGKWLFINLQYPGETLAITGPWDKGVL
jgi:uncharacterized repeat protein (TIGR03803 family)